MFSQIARQTIARQSKIATRKFTTAATYSPIATRVPSYPLLAATLGLMTVYAFYSIESTDDNTVTNVKGKFANLNNWVEEKKEEQPVVAAAEPVVVAEAAVEVEEPVVVAAVVEEPVVEAAAPVVEAVIAEDEPVAKSD
ncbi:uncharacterized protein J8A68_001841 [[Candida] subhashii]|uniref:Uncharacterized protein n=1 Tax=[Candida] subhashii TaxID=561895 RepID=A0A8J5QQ22_9ASCO|nr:uncharacterized protein J8A68_001841 [[Candida] subhashii]KAG7664616.1 hypothetical protein J8A68_001841 [[Candida] subhashii]